ncbi:MAG: hypothetical protein U0414_04610 [Polyangiaceae bacterium]
MKKMIGLLVVVGAFGLGLVGCGDKGGGAGSASAGASAAPKSGGEAKSGGDAKAGGTYDDYVKAYCDCNKDLKCIADQTQKFQAVLSIRTPR